MISLRDSALLAYTKLRTRKIRLIVTVVISALLFTIIATSSFVVRGLVASVTKFSSEGLTNRFIIQSFPNDSGIDVFLNKTVIARAEAIQKDLIARKKAAAKQLDLTYNPTSETSPIFEGPDKGKSLMPSTPASDQAITEYNAANNAYTLENLKKLASNYNPTAFYQQKQRGLGGSDNLSLRVLQNGKEDLSTLINNEPSFGQTGVNTFADSWSLLSAGLIKPFLLDGQSLDVRPDGSLPVVVPFTAAEQILGLEPLSAKATPKQKIERIKTVRQNAASYSFNICYRNSTSVERISNAASILAEINKNSKTKGYVQPDLVYALPTNVCGDVTISRDVRSTDTKKHDANQQKFDELFGKPVAESQIFKMTIVGIVADPPTGISSGLSSLIQSIVSSSIGNNWYTPIELTNSLPIVKKVFTSGPSSFGFSGPTETYFVEFNDAPTAKNFLETESCFSDNYGSPVIVTKSDGSSVSTATADNNKCLKAGKPFVFNTFGSSSLALDELKKNFSKFFKIALAVVAVVASIIMMGTVGRIIADSRRETAVFRAIGAKRLDIAQIYLTYITYLVFIIGLASIIGGTIFAKVAENKYGQQFSSSAVIAYNTKDLNQKFSLYAVNSGDIVLIIGITALSGILSASLPLINNARRNPIKDMRDER